MGIFDYYNKRDSRGLLLGYSALSLSRDMTNNCFMKIKGYGIYKELNNLPIEEFLEIYFKKYFNEFLENISSKIVLYKWYLDNEVNEPNEIILIEDFLWSELLKEIWPESSVPLKIVNSRKRNSYDLSKLVKKTYMWIFWKPKWKF